MTARRGGLRLAVGQAPWHEDQATVVGSATGLVRAAGRSGARVLLLSELYLFGYDVDRYTDRDMAVVADDPRLTDLRRACRDTGVDLLVGAATDADGRRWNSVLRIAADGSVRTVHRKVHVWASEGTVFASGSGARLLEIDGVRIGIGICYDAGFPEYTRALAQAGADLVVFSSAFARGDEERRYDVYHGARALESGVWVAVSNALGQVGASTFTGRSAVFDPFGRPAGALDDSAGIVTVDVDLTRIDEARRSLPYLADLRAEYPVEGAR